MKSMSGLASLFPAPVAIQSTTACLTCALVVDALSGAFILDACCKCYITPYIVVTVCRHFYLMIFLAYLSTHDCVTTGFQQLISPFMQE